MRNIIRKGAARGASEQEKSAHDERDRIAIGDLVKYETTQTYLKVVSTRWSPHDVFLVEAYDSQDIPQWIRGHLVSRINPYRAYLLCCLTGQFEQAAFIAKDSRLYENIRWSIFTLIGGLTIGSVGSCGLKSISAIAGL